MLVLFHIGVSNSLRSSKTSKFSTNNRNFINFGASTKKLELFEIVE